MNTNEDALLGAVADSLKNTETGDKWTLLSPAERKEFNEIVLQVVATLPVRQQIVARCYVDCFEVIRNERSYRILAEEVGRVTGKQENVVNVKSAWHAALKKIGPELERRGFNFTNVE